jgi:CheY-like chemotaxis protein
MDKILVVEDDATMISLLQTLLQMEGFQVVTADQGNQEGILAAIEREKPALTLVDVHLRQVSGLDILKAVRQDQELKDIKIIMSSGMDFSAECFEAGADNFILKPYMPDELIKMIRQALAA